MVPDPMVFVTLTDFYGGPVSILMAAIVAVREDHYTPYVDAGLGTVTYIHLADEDLVVKESHREVLDRMHEAMQMAATHAR